MKHKSAGAWEEQSLQRPSTVSRSAIDEEEQVNQHTTTLDSSQTDAAVFMHSAQSQNEVTWKLIWIYSKQLMFDAVCVSASTRHRQLVCLILRLEFLAAMSTASNRPDCAVNSATYIRFRSPRSR